MNELIIAKQFLCVSARGRSRDRRWGREGGREGERERFGGFVRCLFGREKPVKGAELTSESTSQYKSPCS